MDSDEIIEATRDRAPKRPVLLSSSTVCSVCRNPVYILERVLFTKKLYHRSCFRCSNCDSVLNPQTADISPDGRLFCLENVCHRKLQLLSRKTSESTPKSINKPLERQSEVAISSSVSKDKVEAKPLNTEHTSATVTDSVNLEKQPINVESKPSHTLHTNSKYQSIFEFFSQPIDSHKEPERVEVAQQIQVQVKKESSGVLPIHGKEQSVIPSKSEKEKVAVGFQKRQQQVKELPSDILPIRGKEQSVIPSKPEKEKVAVGFLKRQQQVKELPSDILPNHGKEQSVIPSKLEKEKVAVGFQKRQQQVKELSSDILPNHGKEQSVIPPKSEKEKVAVGFQKRQQQMKELPSDILHTNAKEQSVNPFESIEESDKEVIAQDCQDKVKEGRSDISHTSTVKEFEKVIPESQVQTKEVPIPMDVSPTNVNLLKAEEITGKAVELEKPYEVRDQQKEAFVQENVNSLRTNGEATSISCSVESEKKEDLQNEVEKQSQIVQEESCDDFPNDRLNVEAVESLPIDADKTRAVSFSSIVEVAKIETVSSSEVIMAKMEPVDIQDVPYTDRNVVEASEDNQNSPKIKPKNAFEFIKDNVEILSGAHTPAEADICVTNNLLPEDMLRIHSTKDNEDNQQELTSHNESGVGDSLQSDVKSETDSVNLSIGDSKEKFASDQEGKYDDLDVNQVMSEMEDVSSTSLVLPGGEGEFNENHSPRRLPRLPRSTSPSLDRSPAPTPTPRKRGSMRELGKKKEEGASELWKTKDYYPSELNPFESEDTFTLNPSDILVIKKTSSHERLPPLNPFEDDEDEDQTIPVEPINSPQAFPTPPPKSPAHSIYSTRSADSINGSVRARSRKSHHAPLPPSMMSPSPKKTAISPQSNTREKGPAPPPPIQSLSAHITNNGSPEKKLIPASPDLLKGLKNQANKATAQHYKKKRRAPPPKRFVTPLPETTIKTELADLNIKEKELERQGISLEANIRRLMAQEDDSHEEQIDEMVIQLWNIVNEKNDILRRQTELDYLRRGHRLEELQAEVEFQLRVLMETPNEQRQPGHEEAEQQLLDELLRIVDERNEVVDWLDFHRQIDREEDLHVSQSLTSFSTLSRSSTPTPTHVVLPIKSETGTEESKYSTIKGKSKDKAKEEGKANKKEKFKIGFFSKKKKSSKSKKQDEDKDNDESLKAA